MQQSLKPKLFIGSSTEGLDVARSVELNLHDVVSTHLWGTGTFALGRGTLEHLVEIVQDFDFAAMVLTPDDCIISRETGSFCPRDNVMFELGLFTGRLGRERTFMVYDATGGVKLPSDLEGVTLATFDGRQENLDNAVSPACTQIRRAIKMMGVSRDRLAEQVESASTQVGDLAGNVEQVLKLLARSRAVELKITAQLFGSKIPKEDMHSILKDVEDLQRVVGDKP